MTRYDGFEELVKLTALTKTDKGYNKFVQTGALGLYDYGRGFIDVSIYRYVDHNRKCYVRIYFGTIDDGDFGGFRLCNSKLEANELVEQIANNIFKNMVTLPSHERLNNLLNPYGMYVNYE